MSGPGRRARSRTSIRRSGYVHVAGVDEVGRGCLAGPVVAARRRPPSRTLRGRRRRLEGADRRRRERLFDEIIGAAVAWTVAIVDAGGNRSHQHPSRVAPGDARGRHGARAAARLRAGRRLPHSRPADAAAAHRSAATGKSTAIAAASILAKVTRDRMMAELHAQRSALRLRSAQGLRDARAPRRGRPVRLLGGAPAHVQAAVAV